MHTKKATEYVGKKESFCSLNQNLMQEIQGIRPHVSDRPSDQSTQLGHLSHLDTRYHSRSKKITTPSSVDYV
jgi:hypothetical protein